ncbi:transposase [Bradyrhizobium sp. CCBAU 51627]|uniref:transposase n=1 Tax=Bradyrhizobium sp. CCBAU 51627 TaxID=1325088 RepID=UPI003FA481D1
MANAIHDARQEGDSYRRVEVITGDRRRRRWTGEKTRIAAERLEDGANISEMARRNGVARGLLTVWRRQFAAVVAGKTPSVVPIQIGTASGGGTSDESEHISSAPTRALEIAAPLTRAGGRSRLR